MAAKTSECRINTESFSHVSGSVPISIKPSINSCYFSHVSGSVPAVVLGASMWYVFFPRKWECSCSCPSGSCEPQAFSYVSGSVPKWDKLPLDSTSVFPRKWECSHGLDFDLLRHILCHFESRVGGRCKESSVLLCN